MARIGRVTDERGGIPVCDGETVDARVIVRCTGFAPEYSWMQLPVLDDRGAPRHQRVIATDSPGPFVVGLRFQHRMTSALLVLPQSRGCRRLHLRRDPARERRDVLRRRAPQRRLRVHAELRLRCVTSRRRMRSCSA
jgi:hypothetical protein